jgi:hypothetical protein
MRLALLALLLAAAACGSDHTSPADVCPSGMQSPAYCFSGAQGTATPCGACATIGARCDYFEATLECACDHQWRCAYAGGSSGGCRQPDGGVVCN